MTQLLSCGETPISWFQFDRRLAGELSGSEEERIERHLSSCPACRACWDEVQTTSRQLPALQTTAPESRMHRLRKWLGPATLVPIAAVAILLLVINRSTPGELNGEPVNILKGGDLTFSLLRDHRGDVAADPDHFVSGDRFRVLVTCPPDQGRAWDVVVYQDGEAFFPFEADQRLQCGNEVALPGAFRVTGDSAVEVCLVLADPMPSREQLAQTSSLDLQETEVCRTLSPAGR